LDNHIDEPWHDLLMGRARFPRSPASR
jgi:hypothetical protein